MKKIVALLSIMATFSVYGADTTEKLRIAENETVGVRETEGGDKVLLFQTSKRDRFYWGPEIFWTKDAPCLKDIHVKDNSVYYGATIGYDFLRPNAMYAGVNALYALGRVHVRAKKNEAQGYRERATGAFANVEARFGYNFQTNNNFFLSPYIGLGGYHTRPMRSIRYVQNWLYAAVGMKGTYEVSNDFSVGFNLKGTKALYMEQRFKKKADTASHHSIKNALGYEVSVPLTVKLGTSGHWDLCLEPYYAKLNSQNDFNAVGGRVTLSASY